MRARSGEHGRSQCRGTGGRGGGGRAARWLIVLAAAICALWPCTGMGGDTPIAVLNERSATPDSKFGSVSLLHPQTYRHLATLDTGFKPTWAGYGPDRKYLYILNEGWRLSSFSEIFKARRWGEEASLTVIDLESRTIKASVDLEPFPSRLHFSGDGRWIFVLCRGNRSHAASLLVIDRDKLEVTSTLPLGQATPTGGQPGEPIGAGMSPELHRSLVSLDGRRLYIVRGPPLTSPVDEHPASGSGTTGMYNSRSRLIVFDTVEKKILSDVELPPRAKQMIYAPDEKYIYLLCGGHGKARKATGPDAAQLFILDSATGEIVQRIPAGFDPLLVRTHQSTGRAFLVLTPGKRTDGKIVVLRGADVEAEILIDELPVQIQRRPGSDEVMVLTDSALLLVDPQNVLSRREIRSRVHAAQMVVSSDGKRAYIAAARDPDFVAIDLDSGEVIGKRAAGRIGVKFGKGVAKTAMVTTAVILTIAMAASQFDVEEGVNPVEGLFQSIESLANIEWTPFAPVYFGEFARALLSLSADDRYLQVLNPGTQDLTIFDTSDLSVVEKIPTGDHSWALVPSADRKYHYVLAEKRLTRIEAKAKPVVIRHTVERPKRQWAIILNPERGEVWIPSRTGVEVLSWDTAETKATVRGLPYPHHILFP